MFSQLLLFALGFWIEKEGAVFTRVDIVCDEQKQIAVELKLTGHQVPQLVDAVQKLNEHRTAIV